MTLASMAIAVLTVLAVLIGLLLFVPIGFVARGQVREGPPAAAIASLAAWWGGGLVGVRVKSPGPLEVRVAGRTVAKVPLRDDDGTKKTRSRGKRPSNDGWRPGWRVILRIVRRAIRSLGLEARVRGRLGTGDPADTAQLYLALAALRRLAPGVDASELTVDWLDAVADVEAAVEGHVWPVAALWIVGTELLSNRRDFPRRQPNTRRVRS